MPNKIKLAKRSEKGLLTPDNCVVTIIDLQPQMLFGVSNAHTCVNIRPCGVFGKWIGALC